VSEQDPRVLIGKIAAVMASSIPGQLNWNHISKKLRLTLPHPPEVWTILNAIAVNSRNIQDFLEHYLLKDKKGFEILFPELVERMEGDDKLITLAPYLEELSYVLKNTPTGLRLFPIVEDSDEKSKQDEIKKHQVEIEHLIESHDDRYYQFSIFISHSNIDYLDLHQLLLDLIENKIKPELWFEVVDEEVCDKLCKKIDKSDLFLIYFTKNTINSQMTQNEIGFVEGKRYYQAFNNNHPKLTIKLLSIDFHDTNLRGFYTSAKDYLGFNPKLETDRKKVIRTVLEKYKELNEWNEKKKEYVSPQNYKNVASTLAGFFAKRHEWRVTTDIFPGIPEELSNKSQQIYHVLSNASDINDFKVKLHCIIVNNKADYWNSEMKYNFNQLIKPLKLYLNETIVLIDL
jgi:hypothetical protein